MIKRNFESPNKKIRGLVWVLVGVLLALLIAMLCLVRFSKPAELPQEPEASAADEPVTEPANPTEPATVPDKTEKETVPEETAEDTAPTEPEVRTFPVEWKEEDNRIYVTSQFGTLAYSAAFSDVVQVNGVYDEDVAVLKFEGLIGDATVGLFDIRYGEAEGELLRQIQTEDGETIDAYLAIHDQPQDLSEDDLNTFYAAQEILNEVIASLMEG